VNELWSRVAALMARIEASAVGMRLSRARSRLRRATRRVRSSWRSATQPVRVVAGPVRHAGRRSREAARPGRPPVLYRDGMVTVDGDGVVISSYYLPFGRRRIPFDHIRRVEEYPLSGGRAYRVHGFGWPRHWYHRDAKRAERSVGLVLHTTGFVRPVLTPRDLDAVKALIERRIDGAARRPQPTR
jgi:hypothetical protein